MPTSLLQRIRQELAAAARWLPLAFWFCLMVMTPIALWATGNRGFIALTIAGVLTQLSAVLAILVSHKPVSRWVWACLLIVSIAWLAEFAGIHTGFPFGAYHYTDLFQPQLGGVPLLIPLAWLMMIPPTWAITSRIVSPRSRIAFALSAGLVFTAWDLNLDPYMVTNRIWVWSRPGAYFGIPLSNFLGWWFTAALITLAAAPADLHLVLDNARARSLALIYTLTWLLQSIGLAAFWGQPLPALCGFIGMGIFVLLFWRRVLYA